jgi:hypothetical protein
LRQFAWPNAVAGATTSSTASSAPVRRFAWFVMYRPRAFPGSLPD